MELFDLLGCPAEPVSEHFYQMLTQCGRRAYPGRFTVDKPRRTHNPYAAGDPVIDLLHEFAMDHLLVGGGMNVVVDD